METISVIITSFNQRELLAQALASVLSQSRRPDEIIICDDASADGSPGLIRRYEQDYPGLVRGICHPENLGISRNRNSGLVAATGSLIAWLDGDDEYLPGKLEQEERLLATDPAAGFCYSQVTTKNAATGQSHPRYSDPPEGDIFDQVIFMLGAAPRNPLVRKNALAQVGLFSEELELYEDFDLMVRLAKRFPCRYSPQPGMIYRVHGEGIHKSRAGRHEQNIRWLEARTLSLMTDRTPAARQQVTTFFTRKINSIKAMAEANGTPCVCPGQRLWNRLTNLFRTP